jgi:membrane-bound lytic murein transglycosylase D
VAHEYHIQVDDLAEANHIRENDSLQNVEALAIPAAPVAAATSTHMRQYTARRGDTLVTIADRFGVSLSQLRSWNNISGIKIASGRRLYVAEPTTAHSSSRSRRRGAAAAAETDSQSTTATKKTRGKKGSARTSETQEPSAHSKSTHAKSTAKPAHEKSASKPAQEKSAAKPSHAKRSKRK